ncbi:hypothetical protein BHM03_00021992 [Ensete ventricosum]|nr:hypothetical protein BHM03_00021992 [Ensete ventricosum]
MKPLLEQSLPSSVTCYPSMTMTRPDDLTLHLGDVPPHLPFATLAVQGHSQDDNLKRDEVKRSSSSNGKRGREFDAVPDPVIWYKKMAYERLVRCSFSRTAATSAFRSGTETAAESAEGQGIYRRKRRRQSKGAISLSEKEHAYGDGGRRDVTRGAQLDVLLNKEKGGRRQQCKIEGHDLQVSERMPQ